MAPRSARVGAWEKAIDTLRANEMARPLLPLIAALAVATAFWSIPELASAAPALAPALGLETT